MSSASDTEGGDVADGYSSDVAANEDYDTTEGSGVVGENVPIVKGKVPKGRQQLLLELVNEADDFIGDDLGPTRTRTNTKFHPTAYAEADKNHHLDVEQLEEEEDEEDRKRRRDEDYSPTSDDSDSESSDSDIESSDSDIDESSEESEEDEYEPKKKKPKRANIPTLVYLSLIHI